MDSVIFKNYLINLSLSIKGINTRVQACETIEKMYNENLDTIVSDVIKFKEFLPRLAKIETKKQKYQNALIHYFNFRHHGKKVVFHISYGDSILLKDLGNIIFDVNRAIVDVSGAYLGIKKYEDNTKVIKCDSGSLILEMIIGSVVSACIEKIIEELIEALKKRLNKKKVQEYRVIYNGNVITIDKVDL